ncbi:MAG: hypothetical protein LBI95_01775 [Holosporales bacterium]|nr:hypothetical protein [Holosporales bacterium]
MRSSLSFCVSMIARRVSDTARSSRICPIRIKIFSVKFSIETGGANVT